MAPRHTPPRPGRQLEARGVLGKGLVAPIQVKTCPMSSRSNLFDPNSSPFLYSPDTSSLDFSIWAKYAARVGDSRPKNWEDLVKRLEERWVDVLNMEDIKEVCATTWDRLQFIVNAKGAYIKPKDVDSVS